MTVTIGMLERAYEHHRRENCAGHNCATCATWVDVVREAEEKAAAEFSSSLSTPSSVRAPVPQTSWSLQRCSPPGVDVEPVLEPGPEPGQSTSLMEELLTLYENGEITQNEVDEQPVQLGPIPKGTRPSTFAIAADIDLRLRLRLVEGITLALPYARSEAVKAGHVFTLQAASYALRKLEADGVIRCIGEMPLRGKGNGTKLSVPPGWRPADPEEAAIAIELGDRGRLADLIWVPDELGDATAATTMQPDAEVANELVMRGGGHALS